MPDENDPNEQLDAPAIAQLRERAKLATKQERTIAFLKAGLDPDDESSALARMFVKSYDGELTADAIKAAAKDVGLLQPATTTTTEPPPATTTEGTPPPTAAEQSAAGQQTMRETLAGGQAPGTTPAPTPDPNDVAWERFAAARKAGKQRDIAFADGFNTIIEAAQNGDARVLLP